MKAHKGYPHTFRVSTVRQLALRFSLLLAAIIALLSSGIILLLRMSIRNQQNRELTAAAETVAAALRNGQIREIDGELPYYITYAVYDSASKEITATNDPFLPALPVTPHRAERYTAKQYFSDGYLNILYYATAVSRMDAGNNAGAASGTDTTDSTNTATADGYVIQTALNMDTDTAEAILSGLPRMLAVILGHANLIRRWGKDDPNRLEQSLAAHVRSAGGAGLGLSIVKSIMHALGGSVHTESSDGKGAVIVMQLPRSKFDT